METETIVLTIYWVGVVLMAGHIVWLGSTGRWSKDDWPLFAILAPWFWPIFVLFLPMMVWTTYNECACWHHTGDEPKCHFHGDTWLARRRREKVLS